MSEIITINIGGYGSRIGVKLLEKMQQDYLSNLPNDEQKNNSVFYHEKSQGKLAPRALFFDTDKRLQSVIGTTNFNLDRQAVTCLDSSCRGLFAEGRYMMGPDMQSMIEENVRIQAQRCDNLSGFVLNSSLGGGCGSGLGSHYLCNQQKLIQCFNLVPQYEDIPMNHLQIYNTVLSYHNHIQRTTLDILIENKPLEQYFVMTKNEKPTFDILNGRIADGIIAHIAPYMYSGSLNTNQRKKATNIVTFPRLKNVLVGLSEPNSSNYISSSFKLINRFSRIENYGRIYSSYIDVRDGSAFENQISINAKAQAEKYGRPCEWIPGLFGMSITDKTKKGCGPSAWNLINCEDSVSFLKKALSSFTAQFRRKAYVHHYTSCGIDEMQFTQAESNCNDLISQYIPWGQNYDEEQQQNSDY